MLKICNERRSFLEEGHLAEAWIRVVLAKSGKIMELGFGKTSERDEIRSTIKYISR